MPTKDEATTTLLDTAESLFYEKGYQAVGMAELRGSSGLSLKRIYSLYPSKEEMAVAMLDRRDIRWRAELSAYVDEHSEGVNAQRPRLLTVFDWLHSWLSGPGHRGCAWINAFGELGGTSHDITLAVQRHKDAFHSYLVELAANDGLDPSAAESAYLLAEGCMVTAGIHGSPDAALRARDTLARLIARD